MNLARKEVHKLKLKNQEAWLEYSKSGKKAINIPSNPHKIYPNEWINMGDWLGTYNLADRERSKLFLPFKQARKFARSLKLKNSNDWRRWCKENDTRIISHTPNHNYKSKGWASWGDWLGTEWTKWHQKLKPEQLPAAPQQFYKEWNGWRDWLKG